MTGQNLPNCQPVHLNTHKLPFSRERANFLRMRENARPHTARLTKDFLQHNNIQILPCPPVRPDLGHNSAFLGQSAEGAHPAPPQPMAAIELHVAILKARNNTAITSVSCLIHFMHRRCQTVFSASGGDPPYGHREVQRLTQKGIKCNM